MVKRQASKSSKLWTSAAARRLLALAGNPPTVEEAVRIVGSRVLHGVQCPPTDLDALKPCLNIIEIVADDIPVQGELRPNGGGFKIFHSAALSLEQRRFTIAHEMGHAIFETSGRNCPRVGAELERLCDMLATEILLPADKFNEHLGNDLSIEKIFELKRIFKTSLSATAIRCAELRRASVFEIEGGTVLWGYGFIRKGSLHRVEGTLRRPIEDALSCSAEMNSIDISNTLWNVTNAIWRGTWKLGWKQIGRERRALFLLQPVHSLDAQGG